jgi:hypothetical protein
LICLRQVTSGSSEALLSATRVVAFDRVAERARGVLRGDRVDGR